MSISMNSYCVECLLNKHLRNAKFMEDHETAYRCTKAIMQLFLDAAPEDCSAVMGARINRLYMKYYNTPQDRYREEKAISNRFILERLDMIRAKTQAAQDPVRTGLQYAILGNYIDFSALEKKVSFQDFEDMLEHPERFPVDEDAYESFCRELENGKSLLYLTDNAGELGFDWVLAEQIQKRYPHVKITFCVRGMPAYNDATREDYEFMGLPYPVMDNGSEVGGTDLNTVSAETIEALKNSDVIIAKGMGNVETLHGSGYNVYYAFLIKCKRLEQVFQRPFMSSAFMKERT